jgi:hypothetical protein
MLSRLEPGWSVLRKLGLSKAVFHMCAARKKLKYFYVYC